ncbi:MAG: DUF554 domain-containing protein [Ruminococcaceae bacterium]|nr:DUF554 domain-containing protein [Oscillospiraceae bacterium]
MLGTVVNALAILAGGAVGLLAKGGLKENMRTILNQGVSLAVIFVGAAGCIGGMLQHGANPVLFIISLAVGGVAGELLKIEGRLEQLGGWLQARLKTKSPQGGISQGFVAASLIFCVGTMAVLGSLESGVSGNNTILYAKSLLDGIIAIVMASTLGLGVLFSAASVLLYQGVLTLLAVWVSPFLTADMLRELAIVGGILITAIGLNMLGLTKIRVGNMLPALIVPIIYYAVAGLF